LLVDCVNILEEDDLRLLKLYIIEEPLHCLCRSAWANPRLQDKALLGLTRFLGPAYWDFTHIFAARATHKNVGGWYDTVATVRVALGSLIAKTFYILEEAWFVLSW
jgi:hypothetical protein